MKSTHNLGSVKNHGSMQPDNKLSRTRAKALDAKEFKSSKRIWVVRG